MSQYPLPAASEMTICCRNLLIQTWGQWSTWRMSPDRPQDFRNPGLCFPASHLTSFRVCVCVCVRSQAGPLLLLQAPKRTFPGFRRRRSLQTFQLKVWSPGPVSLWHAPVLTGLIIPSQPRLEIGKDILFTISPRNFHCKGPASS